MSKRAVFVDRDGTVIEDTGFIRRVEEVKLLPAAAEAIVRLNKAGWAVIVVTNQSGVARGLLSEKDIAATNQRMTELLKKEGAHVDAVYYCPHLPEGKVTEYAVVCDCRKPRPGMFLRAAREHDIDLTKSVTIGDAPRDVEAGLNAGTKAILLTESEARADQAPDACGQAKDLLSAVREILEEPFDFARGPEPVEGRADLPAARPAKDVPRKRLAAGVTPATGPEPKESPAISKPGKTAKHHGDSAGTEEPIPEEEPPAVPPEKEEPVSTEEKPIPVYRAPKEFTPEQEVPEETLAPAAEERESVAGPPEKEGAAPAPSPMRCSRCGGVVPCTDVEAGQAFDKDGVRLCRDCVVALRVQKTRGAAPGRDDELLRELQNITRALTYERFSYWHVFGAIGQALAIGCLIITYFRNAAPEGLLWAIFFQLLALTFFVLGRQ
jgi:D-glycero-D-manno-heptose 1,7-bisphosphate phosphatase